MGLTDPFYKKIITWTHPNPGRRQPILGCDPSGYLVSRPVGASQVLVLSDGKIETFFDETLDRRGLGVATVTNPRYFQFTLKGGETLIFCSPLDQEMTDSEDLSLLIGELTLRSEENQALGIAQI
jgi:hypothetical protein